MSTDTAQHTSINTKDGLHKEIASHLSHEEHELTTGSLNLEGDAEASSNEPDITSLAVGGLHASSSSTTGSQATSINTDAVHQDTVSHTTAEHHELTAVAVEANDSNAPPSSSSEEEEEETQFLSVKAWSGTVLRKYGWNAEEKGYAVRELSIFEYTWPACKECSGLHGFAMLQVPGSSADDMIVMNVNDMKFWGGCIDDMQDYQVEIQNKFYDAKAPGHARLMMTYIKGIPQEELSAFYAALIRAGATRVACALPQTKVQTKVRPIDLKK